MNEKVNEKSYDLIGVRTNDVIDNKSGVVTGTGEHNMNDCDDLTWDCTSFEYYRNRFKRRMLQQIVLSNFFIVKRIESYKLEADWLTKSLAPDKHENVRDHYWHKGSVEM